MSEGRIAYLGPRTEALGFFAGYLNVNIFNGLIINHDLMFNQKKIK